MEYSIIVPIYGDGYLAPALCEEVEKTMSTYVDRSSRLSEKLELIFVNDGSPDDSLNTLLELRNSFDFVRIINLSRNFGQHSAIACGLEVAKGEIVLRMNVDMQDSPSDIPMLIDELREGKYDLVVGQYSTRKSPFLNKLSAYIYYSVFHFLTGLKIEQNTSSLRVMSRRFVEAYNSLTEKSRFPQGLDHWLGFKHKYVKIKHHKRSDNRSSYNFWSRLILATDGVLYFSDRPLQLVLSLGFTLVISGFILAIYIIIGKLLGADYLPGYTSLMSIILIAFGIQLGCMGLIGLYIAKIFKEVQNRPLFIIQDKFDQIRVNGMNIAEGNTHE